MCESKTWPGVALVLRGLATTTTPTTDDDAADDVEDCVFIHKFINYANADAECGRRVSVSAKPVRDRNTAAPPI